MASELSCRAFGLADSVIDSDYIDRMESTLSNRALTSSE